MPSSSECQECSGQPIFDFEVSFSLSRDQTRCFPEVSSNTNYSTTVNLSQSPSSSTGCQEMELVLLCSVLAALPYKHQECELKTGACFD